MGSHGSFSIYVTCLGTIYDISMGDFQFEFECWVPLLYHKQILTLHGIDQLVNIFSVQKSNRARNHFALTRMIHFFSLIHLIKLEN